MDYKESIEKLKNLEAVAYGYNINGEVLGMDCSDFEQIMVDAADVIVELSAKVGELEKQLADIKNILGDEYDLDRLRVIMNQRVSLKEEVAERWKLTGDIPLGRLAEIVRAEKEGRIKILTGFECPSCGEKTLFARVDKAAYYCHSCNTRFTKEEAEKALKERENNG